RSHGAARSLERGYHRGPRRARWGNGGTAVRLPQDVRCEHRLSRPNHPAGGTLVDANLGAVELRAPSGRRGHPEGVVPPPPPPPNSCTPRAVSCTRLPPPHSLRIRAAACQKSLVCLVSLAAVSIRRTGSSITGGRPPLRDSWAGCRAHSPSRGPRWSRSR